MHITTLSSVVHKINESLIYPPFKVNGLRKTGSFSNFVLISCERGGIFKYTLQNCKQVVTSLFTSCQQVVFALLAPSLL